MANRRRTAAAVLLQSSSNRRMPIDPSFLPPAASPDELAAREPLPVAEMNAIPASVTPNIGHTLVFTILVAIAGFMVGLIFALVVMHVAPHMHESADQM